jgi:NADH dehydrogenase/NADH:ubiquinone oxidoreductase subunit G
MTGRAGQADAATPLAKGWQHHWKVPPRKDKPKGIILPIAKLNEYSGTVANVKGKGAHFGEADGQSPGQERQLRQPLARER